MGDISWKTRLAIVLSVSWLAIAGAISASEPRAFLTFLVIGVLPIGIVWGIAWVVAGFRSQSRARLSDANETEEEKQEDSRSTLFRFAALLLTIGSLSFLYNAINEAGIEPASKIGYLLGYYIWVPVLVFFAWKWLFKKRKGLYALLLAIAVLAISIHQAGAIRSEQAEAKLLQEKAVAMMLRLINGELIDRSELNEAGKYREVLLVTHEFVSGVFYDIDAFNRKIEASNPQTLLSPSTLTNPANLDAALVSVRSLVAALEQTQNRVIARYDSFPTEIQASQIPIEVKRSFQRGTDAGIIKGKDSINEYFSIQRQFLTAATEMLEFMKSRQGHFEKHGEQILFESHYDLNAYNQKLQKLNELALQEAEWRNMQISGGAREIERLQGLK